MFLPGRNVLNYDRTEVAFISRELPTPRFVRPGTKTVLAKRH